MGKIVYTMFQTTIYGEGQLTLSTDLRNIHCKDDNSIKKLQVKKKQTNVDGLYTDGRDFLIFTVIF